MYVKQISGITDVSEKTVKRVIKELYPDKMVKGKATYLNQEEAESVVNKLRMQKQIADSIKVTEHGQNVQVDGQNVQVDGQGGQFESNLALVLKEQREFFRELIQIFRQPQPVVPVPQIEHKPELYSIKGYCNLKKIMITRNEASFYGKKATVLSREQHKPTSTVADTEWGLINIYMVEILDQVFVDRLNLESNPKLF